MYRVIATLKGTEQETVLETGLTEKQALKFCESWGWSYSDSYLLGDYKSYCLMID